MIYIHLLVPCRPFGLCVNALRFLICSSLSTKKNMARLVSSAALLALVAASLNCGSTSAFGVVPSATSSAATRDVAFTAATAGANRQHQTALSAEAIKISMPALSSTMKEGRVVSWLKNEGDSIEAGEAIMVVESDKADMDVEAFEDGYIAKILVGEGETAPVGADLALVAAEEADIDAVASGSGAAPAAVAEEAPAAEAPAAGEFSMC